MKRLRRANREADLIYTKRVNKLNISIWEILVILIMAVCLIISL